MKAKIIQLTPALAGLGFKLGELVTTRPTAVACDPHSTWADGKWHASFEVEKNGMTCTVAEDLHIKPAWTSMIAAGGLFGGPEKTETTELFIEDTGRNGELEIAVMQGDDIDIYPYTIRDLIGKERLSAAFWKRHGYSGRLKITDSDLGTSYVVEVK